MTLNIVQSRPIENRKMPNYLPFIDKLKITIEYRWNHFVTPTFDKGNTTVSLFLHRLCRNKNGFNTFYILKF